MHVPKGRPVHENLSTSYVNLAALLADLQVNDFTGYVQVNFWNYEGCIFLDEGSLINAIEQTDGALKRGRDAIDSILSRAQARGGSVSFFQHPGPVVRALAGTIDGEIVYRDLASEFTNLGKLVEKLKKSTETTWYVEVVLEKQSGAGIIFIVDGNAEAVSSTRSVGDGGELKTTTGIEALEVLLQQAETIGGNFNVFRAASVSAAPTFSAAMASLPTAPMNVATPAPLPAPASVPRLAGGQVLEVALVADEPLLNPETDVVMTLADEAVVPASSEESPVSLTSDQYSELIALMGEIVAAVERGAVEVVRESDFMLTLREALLKVAEHYPFLDPFAAEFEYSSGEIVFLGAARPADFVVGLSQALHVVIAELSRRSTNGELRERIQTALADLQRSRKEDFDKFGLDVAVEEILGT